MDWLDTNASTSLEKVGNIRLIFAKKLPVLKELGSCLLNKGIQKLMKSNNFNKKQYLDTSLVQWCKLWIDWTQMRLYITEFFWQYILSKCTYGNIHKGRPIFFAIFAIYLFTMYDITWHTHLPIQKSDIFYGSSLWQIDS